MGTRHNMKALPTILPRQRRSKSNIIVNLLNKPFGSENSSKKSNETMSNQATKYDLETSTFNNLFINNEAFGITTKKDNEKGSTQVNEKIFYKELKPYLKAKSESVESYIDVEVCDEISNI